jgi:6-pyruvoyltetrahydropterin/6-carboxytetrahydropterin synthase
MFTLRKKFRFEMSHILMASFSEACQMIHGHSYILEVFIQAEGLDADGMVVDFGRIKQAVEPIVKELDHRFLYCAQDARAEGFKDLPGALAYPVNPTAENMAMLIFNELNYSQNLPVYKVRLHETETGYVEYQASRKGV